MTKFRADGYRSARIEDLAEMAQVSVGTVYNYYQTKGDILIATVAMEVEEVLAAGAKIVAAPPKGVEAALLTLIWAYYDHSLEYLSKEMWRSAMALALQAPDTPNGQRYAALDAQLAAQVTQLLWSLQHRGEIAAHLDTDAMGQIAFSHLNQAFMGFVQDEGMALDTLRSQVAAQLAPFCAMMTP